MLAEVSGSLAISEVGGAVATMDRLNNEANTWVINHHPESRHAAAKLVLHPPKGWNE
jgi:hypothetical protein